MPKENRSSRPAHTGTEDMVEIDLTGLVLPDTIETTFTSEDGRTARFVVEPLERGYGHTLGNAVRRVLLSSLRGSAIWAFRINGVVHEHQTIPGVVEDVHQVIQNLKALVVDLEDEALDVDGGDAEDAAGEEGERSARTRGVTLQIVADKAGPVTAAHIQERGGVRILDPDHHILTLQEDKEFRMEVRVDKGRGFVLADQHPLEKKSPVDLVRIDSIYNPVRRANFEVKETRVGQRTDFDQLTLHVETDGSVSPEDAVATASQLLRKHLEYLLYFGEGGLPMQAPAGATPVPENVRELFARPIEDLAELSVRSRNSLQKESISTVGELIQRTEDEMLDIENFGKKSLKEIQDFLAEHNLRFGMKLTQADDGRLFFMDEEATADAAESIDG
jgi:DNA-directed RNA polymerase subunit alpha